MGLLAITFYPPPCMSLPLGQYSLGVEPELLGLLEVPLRFTVVPKVLVRNAPAVIGQGVLWVETNGLVEVLYR